MSDATHASRTGLGKEKLLDEQTWNFLVMPQIPTIDPLSRRLNPRLGVRSLNTVYVMFMAHRRMPRRTTVE